MVGNEAAARIISKLLLSLCHTVWKVTTSSSSHRVESYNIIVISDQTETECVTESVHNNIIIVTLCVHYKIIIVTECVHHNNIVTSCVHYKIIIVSVTHHNIIVTRHHPLQSVTLFVVNVTTSSSLSYCVYITTS